MVSTIETRYGPMRVPNIDRDLIGQFLARYGEWADLELRFVASNISENICVADIGAFVGTFGIGLSHHRRLRQICFVEGNTEVLSCLRRNVSSNCKAKNTIVESFLFPNDKKYRTGHRDANNLGSLSFAPRVLDNETIDVAAPKTPVTLSKLRGRFGSFDFIKLDIEGLEFAVLNEEEEWLKEGRTSIWAECNENIVSLDLADFLLSCHLKVYFFAFPSFNRDNFLSDSDPIFPFAYESGLFATSGEAHCEPSLANLGCIFEPIEDREMLRRALWKTPRWVPKQWISEHPEQTIALALHKLKMDNYATFLLAEGEAENSWPDIESAAFVPAVPHSRLQELEDVLALERTRHESDQMESLRQQNLANAQLLAAQEALALEQARSESDEIESQQQLNIVHSQLQTARNSLAVQQVQCDILNSQILTATKAIDFNQVLLNHRQILLQAMMEQSISWRSARGLQRMVARIPGATYIFKRTLKLIYKR